MKMKLVLAALIFGLVLPLRVVGDPLPTTAPESIGLSSKRLELITDTLRADIAKGTIPGVVRHGKIGYFEAMGSLDPEKRRP